MIFRILGYANAFMETLKKQINRSSMTINASGQSFRGFDSIRRQLKEVKRRVCMDGDYKKMTSSFLSVVEEQEKKQELQKSEQLHASLKEFLSQNEVHQYMFILVFSIHSLYKCVLLLCICIILMYTCIIRI